MGNEIMTVDAHMDDVAIEPIANTEARADMMKAIIPAMLKVCHEGDITDIGGKPYPGHSACQKVASFAGISFGHPETSTEMIDAEDGSRVFCVKITGDCTFRGKQIRVVGGSDSADPFLCKRGLPFHRLKLEVEKKAYANWYGRCVRAIIGLSGLSWKDLEAAGVKREGRAKVEFKEGSKSHRDEKPEQESADAAEVKQKIREQLLKNLDNNVEDARKALKRLTTFTKDGKEIQGKDKVDDLSDKWAFSLWGKIKPGGKERENYDTVIMDILAERTNKVLGE